MLDRPTTAKQGATFHVEYSDSLISYLSKYLSRWNARYLTRFPQQARSLTNFLSPGVQFYEFRSAVLNSEKYNDFDCCRAFLEQQKTVANCQISLVFRKMINQLLKVLIKSADKRQPPFAKYAKSSRSIMLRPTIRLEVKTLYAPPLQKDTLYVHLQ